MTSTSNESRDVVALVLDGLETGRDLDELLLDVGAFHRKHSTFPAEVLLELAADSFSAARVDRTNRLQLDGLAERVLPEWPARGNVAHQKRRHCLHAAVLLSAGVDPEDTSWWRVDDLWVHALQSLVVFARAAAERRGVTVTEICHELRNGG